MSIRPQQFNDACQIVLKAIKDTPYLDDKTRITLETRVNQIASAELLVALKYLEVENLPDDKNLVSHLVYAIEHKILVDSTKKIAQKIVVFTTNRLLKTNSKDLSEEFDVASKIVSKSIARTPGLDDTIRNELKKKFDQIRELDLKETLKLLNLEEISPGKESIPLLIYAMEKKILEESSEEISNKIYDFTASHLIKPVTFDSNEKTKSVSSKAHSKKITKTPESFASLNLNEITFKKLSQTFENELYRASHSSDENLNFYIKSFESALNAVIEKGEKSPHVIFDTFFEKFEEEIAKTTYTEEISRGEFQILVGKYAGGKGKSALDLTDPHIMTLFEEYIDGTWKDEEKRELTITYVSKETDVAFRKKTKEILKQAAFKNALLQFAKNEI